MKIINLPIKLHHRSVASFLGVPKPHYACVSAVAQCGVNRICGAYCGNDTRNSKPRHSFEL